MKNNHQIALYVPSTKNVDQVADTSKYVSLVAKFFAVWFGGSTVQETEGYYWSDDLGKLIKEKVYRVYSFTGPIDEKTRQRVIGLAQLIKTRLSQEMVGVELLEYQSEGFLLVA